MGGGEHIYIYISFVICCRYVYIQKCNKVLLPKWSWRAQALPPAERYAALLRRVTQLGTAESLGCSSCSFLFSQYATVACTSFDSEAAEAARSNRNSLV